jgi:hypothetical protein
MVAGWERKEGEGTGNCTKHQMPNLILLYFAANPRAFLLH